MGEHIRKFPRAGYVLLLYWGVDPDPENDNRDVEVRFESGERYTATLFTPENVKSLLIKWRADGDESIGMYLHCPDMLIVPRMELESVIAALDHIVTTGEYRTALKKL